MKKKLPYILLFTTISIGSILDIAKGHADTTTSTEPAVSTTAQKQAIKPQSVEQVATKVQARPWAQELSDIKPDPSVIYGKLDNGMRYVIYKNKLPPKRASFRLHINAGSLSETDQQRGLAHFLEHMVFNGTRTFPDASKLIPQMQRLGIAYGAHANAYTYFDETVYSLDLPNIEKSTMDIAYNVMADFADGALLKPDEIKKELGVISAEKTSSDSIQQRLMKQRYKKLMPKSRLANRFPIGTDKTLAALTHDDFTSFYKHNYTPQKMTLIVVGDIDITQVKQRIQSVFGGMKNPNKQAKRGEIGDISGATSLQANVFSDVELSTTDVSLTTIRRKERKIDTIANRAKKIPLDFAHHIINLRLNKLSKKEGALITSGYISSSLDFREIEMGSINVTAKNHNWQAAVAVLEQELRRAIEHGFTENEYKEVLAETTNDYEQAVLSASTRKTPSLASSLTTHIHEDYVFSTLEDDLQIFKQNTASLSPEKCHQALIKYWKTNDLNLVLSTKVKPEKAGQTLLSLYKKSQKIKVEPPKTKDHGTFFYTDFGKAGEVASKKYIKDMDLHQIQFKNGVRVNYKKTNFDKNKIIINAHFGTGLLGLPKDKPGLDLLASDLMNKGGYGKHSIDDLLSLFAGKNVGVGFSIDSERFSLGGTTTPKDLELQLQLITAMFIDAGFRPEAERHFKASLPELYSQLKHSEHGALVAMDAWMYDNDPRFIYPAEAQAKALTTAEVKQWIDPQLKHSALELGIIGDFDEANLIKLLAKSVGALPKRNKPISISDNERKLTIPQAPVSKTFHYESKVKKALVLVHWKAEGNTQHDAKLIRRASILAEVLNERLRIKLREEMGDSYSPTASTDLSQTYKDVGFIIASSSAKPKEVTKISKAIIEIGKELASKGISKDELDRALTPRLGMLQKQEKENSYWLYSVISQSQTQPYRIAWARERDDDYKSISVNDINVLAKKYLGEERSLQVEISPYIDGSSESK